MPNSAFAFVPAPIQETYAPLCAARTVARSTAVPSNGEITSVGITYFAGRSRTGDDAHLATALTTELARQLLSARMTGPAPRRGEPGSRLLTVKLSDGGGLADVDLSMTGSVFRDESGLRTTAKVTRTSDGAVLWSGTKSRPILELPVLARLVAQEVVTRIGARLSSPAPKPAPERSAEMYEMLLRGTFVRSRYDADELTRAIGYFDQALAMEPGSVRARELREQAQLRLLAWGGKGGALESQLVARGTLKRVPERAREESERLIEEADAEIRDGQLAHACQLLNAAIENDAHATPAYALRSLVRSRGGEVREAFGDAETVTQLGRPLWGNALRAIVLNRAGDTTSARQVARRVLAQTRQRRGALPFWDARFAAVALTEVGDHRAAQDVMRRVDARDPRIAILRSDPMLQPPTTKPTQRPARRTR
jgi:TolB-like protein